MTSLPATLWRAVRHRWPAPALVLLLVGLTLIAFSPAGKAGFLNYDDPHYVTNNPNVLNGLRVVLRVELLVTLFEPPRMCSAIARAAAMRMRSLAGFVA